MFKEGRRDEKIWNFQKLKSSKKVYVDVKISTLFKLCYNNAFKTSYFAFVIIKLCSQQLNNLMEVGISRLERLSDCPTTLYIHIIIYLPFQTFIGLPGQFPKRDSGSLPFLCIYLFTLFMYIFINCKTKWHLVQIVYLLNS